MLITKFNKMIRNKILWLSFALIVCISFVGGSIVSKSGCSDQGSGRSNVAGILYGEEIPVGRFLTARFFEMGMRQRGGMTPEAESFLKERTWKRLAALETAKRLGVIASDEEVAQVIQRDPSFAVNGVFNPDRYQAVVASQLRIDIETFEQYVRQDLLIRKLGKAMEWLVWTSPRELNEKIESLSDTFVAEYAVIPTNIVDSVDVSEERAREFFAEYEENFRIPEQVNVAYVVFPITNAPAATDVSEDRIIEYYEANLDDYTAPGTNNDWTTLPLEDVEAQIRSNLQFQAATILAKNTATDFVMDLAPDRYGTALSWESAAAKHGLTTATSAFFTAREAVPGLDVDSGFNRAAFDLIANDPEAYFSDAVVGRDAVYVLSAGERREPRMPEFEEVRDKVMPRALRTARREAFLEKSEEIRSKAKTQLAEGESFTAAMKVLGFGVATTEAFTVYSESLDDFEYADIIVPSVITLRPGELTEPLSAPGGALLAYVAERTPGDAVSAQMLIPQLVSTLDRYRAEIAYAEWSDQLLKVAAFKDLMPRPEEDDDDEETEL